MACCIFALSCPDPAPSAAYIAMHGADVEFENDDLENKLRRWYATEDVNNNLHNTLDPKTTVARRRHTTAVKFLKEWKLHKWVETTNLEKALAPCSSLMCQLGGPPGIEPAAIPFVVGSTCKHKSKLQWCRRWRRRWNVQLGKFCAGERLEPHVAHAKVHDNVWLRNPPGRTTKASHVGQRSQKRGPHFGPISGVAVPFFVFGGTKKTAPFSGILLLPVFISEATAVWHWCNFLHDQIQDNKKPLRVNMDETSVRMYPVMRAGSVAYVARLEKRTPRSLTTNVTRGQMRGSMSLVCFVCDDAEVQKTLPQILLVKKQFAPAHMLAARMAAVQPPLAVWVVDNSWMTAEMMNKVLTHLSTCLQGWAATHQIILSADAYRSHIAPKVWRRAAALKIMMFVIPAKMTWALQPCDTHVFAKMKHYLACEVQAEIIKAADIKLSVLMVVVAVNRAVRQVVTMGNWRMAFWDLGLTGVQACISETCLQKLEIGNGISPASAKYFTKIGGVDECLSGEKLPSHR